MPSLAQLHHRIMNPSENELPILATMLARWPCLIQRAKAVELVRNPRAIFKTLAAIFPFS
jgi:hypothetical protein